MSFPLIWGRGNLQYVDNEPGHNKDCVNDDLLYPPPSPSKHIVVSNEFLCPLDINRIDTKTVA